MLIPVSHADSKTWVHWVSYAASILHVCPSLTLTVTYITSLKVIVQDISSTKASSQQLYTCILMPPGAMCSCWPAPYGVTWPPYDVT